LRVAVVCPYDIGRPGGVQQLTVELVGRLGDAGHEAWLVGPGQPPDSDQRPMFRSVGRTVSIRANASVVPVALSPRVPRRVREAVADAEVIHVHEPLMPLVSLAALRLRMPRVVTFHADPPGWTSTVYRSVGRIADGAMRRSVVTAVSPVAAAVIPDRWGEVVVVPNGLDVAAYQHDQGTRRPNRVTFLGRDDPRKGLDVLLEAWEGVQEHVPAAELIVIGSRRDGAIPGVRFAGRVDEREKRALLASASVHVAPNTGGESFGIVVAEAMAAGAAVIASDLPAFRDVVRECGTFVPVGQPAALREAIIGLLGDPAALRRHADCARIRVADFDWRTVLDRWIDAYGQALRMSV
jgi:phosphatidyl-myo-inositol alpha-mannosyltransferase